MRLGEVTKVISGYAFKSKDFTDSGIPVIKIKNIKNGYVDLSDVQYIEEEFLSLDKKFHISTGDILISLTGSHLTQPGSVVGRVAIQSSLNGLCLLNQRAGKIIVTNPEKCNSKYLFYYLNTEESRYSISSRAHGAANQANVSPGHIESLEIDLPPLPIQQKIANILSAYDDLIENNTRRIQILEEMAQRIYREWFVHFSYPDHENDKLVENELGMIPEGWEVKTLEDVLSALESGSRPRGGIDPNVREMPSIGAENVLGLGKYDYSKEKFVKREYYEGMNKGHIKSGDVLLYKDGAKLGRKSMLMNGFPHNECCINEHVFILRANELCSQAYLYFWLDLPNVTQDIINLNTNAAQPGINQRDVKSLPILVANPEKRIAFDDIVYPILNQIFNLAKKNNNLCHTRNLLLPQLISGKINVLELDIDIGTSDEPLQ